MRTEQVMLIIGDGTVSIHPIPQDRFVIGAAPECDVIIRHPSVSQYHAVIDTRPSLAVRYIGAANAHPAARDADQRGGPRSLRPGDSFRIGALSCLIIAGAPGEPVEDEPVSEICVKDPTVRGVPAVARAIAASTVSLLIFGETGAGKDVLAQTLHELSNRTGPYVRINCAALAEALLESEMFGHEKGAFTGASVQKSGLLESAHGGTVFLDEIGELSPALQAKLLRAVESGEVTRVGSVRPTPIDVRFIAATHRDLAADVASGRFRSDLFYRLDGASLTIPPLRERREQIIPLALQFIASAQAAACRPISATPGFLARLEHHDWPGNVRELKATVERAVLLAAGSELTPSHLLFSRRLAGPRGAACGDLRRAGAAGIRSGTAFESVLEPATASTLEPAPRSMLDPASSRTTASAPDDLCAAARFDRARIIEALDACAGNQTRAAKKLGISRATLTHRLTLYRLPRPQS